MDSHLEKGAVPPRGRRLRFVLLAAASFFLLSFVAIFALGDFQLAALGFQQADDTPVEEEKVERPLFTAKTRNVPTGDKYLIGVGKADITGPVVEINFAGYADSSQVGTGLRQRIYARSFIVADVANPNDRFVYIVVDTSAGDTAMRYGVLEGLKALGSEYDVYGSSNVALTGTHSHSGPGGWFNYLLPQITSLGFSKESLQAIVDGTVLSIKRAHESLAPVSYRTGRSRYGARLTCMTFFFFNDIRATWMSGPPRSKMATHSAVCGPTWRIPRKRGNSTATRLPTRP